MSDVPALQSPAREQQVTLTPSGRSFHTFGADTLLEAGLRAGIALPFRCSSGNCGECRARVISGTTRRVRHHDYTFSAAEKRDNLCLMCCHSALEDVTLEVIEARSSADIPPQQLRATRCRLEISDGMAMCAFKFTRGKALRYLPGQLAILQIGNSRAALPIASCPCNRGYVEFHLPTHHELYRAVTELPARERITIAIDQPTQNPVLDQLLQPLSTARCFIVWGNQFARVQGILEHLLNLETEQSLQLVWVADSHCGHYRHSLCRSWADAYDELSYYAINADTDAAEKLLTFVSTSIDDSAELVLCGNELETAQFCKQMHSRKQTTVHF